MLETEVSNPDSPVMAEHHSLADSAFTFTFTPGKGSSLVALRLRDSFGNDTSVYVRVLRNDVKAPEEKPLYNEIRRRPGEAKADGGPAAGEAAAAAGIAAGATAGEATPVAANDAGTTAGEAGGLAMNDSGTPDADSGIPQAADSRKGCGWWWWIIILAALLFFFLLWRRKRKINDEKQ